MIQHKPSLIVGNKVKLSQNSQYYGEGFNQLPPGKIGTIIDIDDGSFLVQWKTDEENTGQNSYTEKDLILINF